MEAAATPLSALDALIREFMPLALTLLHFLVAVAVTVDAVLRKRPVPAVIGWVGVVWLAPLIGSVLYLLLGINRIRRTALALGLDEHLAGAAAAAAAAAERRGAEPPEARLPPAYASLARVARTATGRPLQGGNRIEPLESGDTAYPAMLEAIGNAQRTVTLLTYIFDNDRAGAAFLQALVGAHNRGVQVRVLIDDVGARYSRPTMLRLLSQQGVRVAAFLPTVLPRLRYANLRNHRKILVVDGVLGFVGGMNIRESHWLALQPALPTQCIHFRVSGPVVADLQRVFVTDWAFTTRERLDSADWFPPLEAVGDVLARGLPDGPDADLDNIPHVLHAALSVAATRVRIVTPYFLPDIALLQALQVAALRGVRVEIVLPARSNLPVINWAMTPQLPELVARGCRIYRSPAPFDHSKMMVVDGLWCLIGSTNWDARSLRLNFEYNLECYSAPLATMLDALIDRRIAESRQVSAQELQAMPFAVRLRDGLARLLSPYL